MFPYDISSVKVQDGVVTYTKLYQKDEKHRLNIAKEELESMKYHPLQEHKPVSGRENEHNVTRKKSKSCISCEALTLIPPIFVYLIKTIGCLRMTLFIHWFFTQRVTSSSLLNFLCKLYLHSFYIFSYCYGNAINIGIALLLVVCLIVLFGCKSSTKVWFLIVQYKRKTTKHRRWICILQQVHSDLIPKR